MPNSDEEIQDMDSSNMSGQDEKAVVTEKSASTEPAAAASSPATGETEDKDLLSVVRDVVDKSKTDASVASPAEGNEEKVEDKAAKEPDDENYSDVPFNTHPRFRELVRKVKTYKADAERFQGVQRFLDESGLSGTEAEDGLQIMALAKTNPVEAWTRIKPFVKNLLIAAGEVLPDDLDQRVQTGELTPAAAQEISRHRAAAQSVQASQSFREQLEQRRQQQAAASALMDTAKDWEEDRRKKDPNFEAKLVALQKEIAWMQATEGKPTTPEGVKAMLQKAYKAVNDSAPPAQPAAPVRQHPRPITPVRGGQVAGNQTPEPRSTLDIIRAHRRTG